ncbi:MAG: ribosomal protection-like ABC-F family protein [Anaerotignum sp.]
MSYIQVTDVTFAYEGSYDNIFEDVSFRLDTDWKLGLIGRNGRGKTTFLKLLMGQYEYSGTISADMEFAYFPYEVERKDWLTIDILREICPHAEDWEIIKEVSRVDVEEEALWRPFETLSDGEQGKALLAALFLKEHAFLLIDEPTNHLDLEGRKAVSRYLQQKKGFILVSHDRILLDECIDHVLAINRNNIEVQRGNFSSWKENKDRQDAYEFSENKKLRKDIKRLEKAAKQASRWSEQVEKTKNADRRTPRDAGVKADKGYIGHKAEKMMCRSKSLERRQETALEEKTSLLRNIDTADDLKLSPLTARQSPVVYLKEVSVKYGEKVACQGVSFEIEAGEQVALRGKNGCGKSTILKLILGEEMDATGEFRRATGLKISYVPQKTDGLQGDLRDYAEEYGIDESLFKAILRKLGFSREQFDKRMGDFSDGQKKKVLIARSLCEEAHLYIWDEPLNYIDVFSRMQIEDLLQKYRPTLLFVEHDAVFCEKIAEKVVEL